MLIALRLLLICILTAFLFSPFLFIDWRTSLADLANETTKGTGWSPQTSVIAMVTVSRYAFSDVGAGMLALGAGRGLQSVWRAARTGKGNLRALLANRQGDPMPGLVLVVLAYSLLTLMNTIYSEKWFAAMVPFLSIVIVVQLRWLPTCLGRPWGNVLAHRFGGIASIGLLLLIAQHQLVELASLSRMRLQPSTTARAETWLAQHVRAGQSVLLLQGSRVSPHAQFPRIRVPAVQLFTVAPAETIQRVCPGEAAHVHRSDGPLSNTSCYPRPTLPSQSRQPLTTLLKRFDFIVVSNGQKQPLTPEEVTWLNKVPATLTLVRPPSHHRLSYPRRSIPDGEWGAWPDIRIYRHKQ